ncbi:MAG: transposase, partial [Clostridiales bacterium]|nr:transposase [Clostridiales bacterium]
SIAMDFLGVQLHFTIDLIIKFNKFATIWAWMRCLPMCIWFNSGFMLRATWIRYAVCTDLLDDDVADILKVSEGRWQIEECFRIMKTDFSARPIYLQEENRIKAHFLICYLALLSYRLLEKKLDGKYTCEKILDTLKSMNFAEIEEQGFMPLYTREKITDDLHEACGFHTDY